MADRLRNKVAIITGAGQGIGAAIARAFVAEGAAVVVAERNVETGERVAAELTDGGGAALFIQTDVTDAEAVRDMVARAGRAFGSPSVLVNNAGINVFRDPLAMTDQDWRDCMAVDLDGAWHCCRAVLPAMIAAGGGAIINIASTHSFTIIPGCFPYPVAKHALIGLTRSLGIEYAPRGVRVNAIAPGYIETELATRYWDGFADPAAERRRVMDLHPPRRIGRAEEVAMTAVFLASDEAPFINAACIVIDGGRSVLYHE